MKKIEIIMTKTKNIGDVIKYTVHNNVVVSSYKLILLETTWNVSQSMNNLNLKIQNSSNESHFIIQYEWWQ